jgi:hypothetical protein
MYESPAALRRAVQALDLPRKDERSGDGTVRATNYRLVGESGFSGVVSQVRRGGRDVSIWNR